VRQPVQGNLLGNLAASGSYQYVPARMSNCACPGPGSCLCSRGKQKRAVPSLFRSIVAQCRLWRDVLREHASARLCLSRWLMHMASAGRGQGRQGRQRRQGHGVRQKEALSSVQILPRWAPGMCAQTRERATCPHGIPGLLQCAAHSCVVPAHANTLDRKS
jgi:hypothetical protein